MFHIIQFSAPSLTAKLNYTSDIMRHHQKETERGGRERGTQTLHSTRSWAIPASLFPADLTFYDLMVVWLPHSWHRVSLVMANILTSIV